MKKREISRFLLLAGMALMIPCYLFTAANTLFAPWELYGRNRAALAAAALAGAAGMLLALRAADRHEAFLEKHEKRVLLGAVVFYFAVQMLMASALRFEPKTDAEQCITAAKMIAAGESIGSVERPFVYFTRYPHNLGFVYALAAVFRFFGLFGWTDWFMQGVLVSSLLFSAGLVCGARAMRRIGGAKAEMRMLALFATCLPFLYCTTELYTDAFSMAFPLMTLYAFIRLREAETGKGRALWATLFACASFAGAQIRFTAVVMTIACMIALLFERRGRACLCAALALCAAFFLGGQAMDAYTHTHLAKEDIEKNELPKLHYVAMGLPVQPDEGYGQYGTGGWLIFSTSFEDPQERKEALLREVIDRVYYLRYPNRLMHMLSRKNLSTFGTGTFTLHEIIQSDRPEPDCIVKQIMFETGTAYPAYYHLTTGLFAAQMLIACMACAGAIRRRDTRGAPVFIALVGMFLLLSCWETRGRYFFQYVPVLLCAAALIEPGKARRESMKQ
ncbi:MAG: hypothetical protein IJD94_07065 [Clostridia bacterium]|nr:hypothetical protein [Clostridia bacterium]